MSGSLSRRLLLVASLVLLAFLGGTGLVLERAFVESLQQAQQDRLQGALYTVLAAAEFRRGTLIVPSDLPEPRLSTPGSGLYVSIIDAEDAVWRSGSTLGVAFAPAAMLAPGQTRLERIGLADEPAQLLGYGLSWEEAGEEARFTIYVAEDLRSYFAQLGRYRRSLWGGLAVLALALVLIQFAVLRWSLSPLRRVTRDLDAIRAGDAETLTGTYPREIQPLTANLNALIAAERGRSQRYRDTMADLAHSLKTPLAVLRGMPALAEPEAREQLERIGASVDYQLRRAASSSRDPLAPPLPVAPVAERLLRALAKVYAEPPRQVEAELAECGFRGSEGDLMELLGNLLDNAFKWARARVRIAAGPSSEGGLVISVEDDGPGIPAPLAGEITQRGRRGDEQVPGQGIGLAVVREIVDAHGGTLRIERSVALSGAKLTLELP